MLELPKSVANAALRAFDARLQKHYEPYLAHFRKVVGYQPSIAIPSKYHEKMLWRKLFDHSPDIATFCDKLATKDHILARIPELRLPQTLWVGERLEDIPASLLGERLMLKSNHGCGFNRRWIPKKTSFNEVCGAFREWLGCTYGTSNYEWGYSAVKPKVFAEEYINADSAIGLVDIKVRCCDGKPVLARIHLDGLQKNKKAGWFSIGGDPLFKNRGPLAEGDEDMPTEFQLPDCFHEAIEASRVLGSGIDYVRVDFLTNGSQLLGGEITTYPAAGLGPASPAGVKGPDTMTNDCWDLRKSWFLTAPQRGVMGLYAAFLKKVLL